MKLYFVKQLKTSNSMMFHINLVKNGLLADHVDTNLMSELLFLKKDKQLVLIKTKVFISEISDQVK